MMAAGLPCIDVDYNIEQEICSNKELDISIPINTICVASQLLLIFVKKYLFYLAMKIG
jgi:hypothetical protein